MMSQRGCGNNQRAEAPSGYLLREALSWSWRTTSAWRSSTPPAPATGRSPSARRRCLLSSGELVAQAAPDAGREVTTSSRWTLRPHSLGSLLRFDVDRPQAYREDAASLRAGNLNATCRFGWHLDGRKGSARSAARLLPRAARLPIFAQEATTPTFGPVSNRGKTRFLTLEPGLP